MHARVRTSYVRLERGRAVNYRSLIESEARSMYARPAPGPGQANDDPAGWLLASDHSYAAYRSIDMIFL